MLKKNFKFIIIVLLYFYTSSLYSKNISNNEFNSKNLARYFSALISYDNQENSKALEFFNSSKSLIKKHDPYLKEYIFSLIIESKNIKAIKELKYNLNKNNSDFFESYLLLMLDSIKRKDFSKSNLYQQKLPKFIGNDAIKLVIYETLKNYNYLFQNKEILKKKTTLGNLSLVNNAFELCYLGSNRTNVAFLNLVNNPQFDDTRYLFFYINHLISEKKIQQANEVSKAIEILNSSLLVGQSKNWVDRKEYYKFNQIFSCKNELHILSEFFFLIGNLYSSENDLINSNFYLSLSNFLNPKFKFNLSMMVENYYQNGNYEKSDQLLKKFNKNDDLYYWYKIKKKSRLILKKNGDLKSFNYINSNFKKIKNPPINILFDMANIAKGFEKYKIAISYYDKILTKIDNSSAVYPNILYRRGGSLERLGQYKKSDLDLIQSLEINPNNAYVLNYLAYSWLERNYKINEAIKMLERAYRIESNDPFILDSVGWAYYLINDLTNAEIFIRRAIKLMPEDPIVNDHYGDILWKMNRKLEATYYWKSILYFDDAEESMKKNIKNKILVGLKKT